MAVARPFGPGNKAGAPGKVGMRRKQPIPGVDQAALAALAGQFPSVSLPTLAPPTGIPPIQDNAPLPPGDKEIQGLQSVTAVGAPPRQRAGGRGLAACAMLLAILALLIAATSVMPAPARVWLDQTLGDWRIVTLVTASRAEIDNRLTAASQSIDALTGKQDALAVKEGDIAARLEAVEAVIGSGAATRRLETVETDVAAMGQRLAAAADLDRNAAARAEALETRMTTFDGDLKAVQDKLAADEQEVKDILGSRIAAVEADVGALQKIDRRPEKFFMASLQLRDVTRTASPFAREVTAAQALAGDNADLNAALKLLAGDADHGVATVAELRDNFTTILGPRLAAVAAANRQPVAERAWDWLQSLFTTAAPAGAAGDRNAALIALATKSLAQDQLEAAVHQLVLLEDEAALVAAEWLNNASTRLAADKAIATVMAQALDRLAAAN
jgi:hypothetical protein